MAILDAFKKRKKIKEKKIKKEQPVEKPLEKISTPRTESKRVSKISEARLPSLEAKATRPTRFATRSGRAYRILKAPHITEKATDLAGKNQHVFKIWKKTNKVEIKKAIEDLYKVKVIDVKIIKVPAKKRRFGRISGWKKGYKKAIVKIKEGQKIELFPK